MADHALLALAMSLAFAAVHVLSPRLVFLDERPRSVWLSVAGGVSTAYVFAHLLPELAEKQRAVAERLSIWRAETEVFTAALLGLAIFYGLERLARRSRGSAIGYGVHLGAFALYNLLIAWLLRERAMTESVGWMALYGVAMGLHFLVNDRALHAHHPARHVRFGRWLLAAAPPAGWAFGFLGRPPELWIGLALALLGGGVILNVLKEELPEERESRFWAFALGAGGYAALLNLL
jgi:hypothetical protein